MNLQVITSKTCHTILSIFYKQILSYNFLYHLHSRNDANCRPLFEVRETGLSVCKQKLVVLNFIKEYQMIRVQVLNVVNLEEILLS